jgi:hypothetical protein
MGKMFPSAGIIPTHALQIAESRRWMTGIFISYSRKDSGTAHKLMDSFTSIDLDVWVDWELFFGDEEYKLLCPSPPMP